MSNQGGQTVRNVIRGNNRQQPAQPKQRQFTLSPLVSPQFVGTPIDATSLGIQRVSGPPGSGWIYYHPSTEIELGDNNITVEAPAARGWLRAQVTRKITGVRATVPLNWTLKPSWKLHETVTPDTLGARYDGSALTHNYGPILRVTAPPNGDFTAPGDKVTVTLEIIQDDCFAAVKKTATVKVEKEAAVLHWKTPLPVLVNSRLGTAQLNATTTPVADPGKMPVPTYTPAPNEQLTKAGTVTLKASFAGNTWFAAAADKTVTLKVVPDVTTLGTEAMRNGQAWKGPQTVAQQQVLDRWNTDDSDTGLKKTARKVMSDIKSMTTDELVDYMDTLIGTTGSKTNQPGTFPNIIWELPNGLQVRYKPLGDGQQPPGMPPVPMFCVEGKTCAGPSTNKNQVAFKVTIDGEPGAYGPKETQLPPGIPTNKNDPLNQQYMGATITTTHLPCKPKVLQTITWTKPSDITVGTPLGKQALNATPQDPNTVLTYKDGSGSVVTEITELPAGRDQVLEVTAAETKKYLAVTVPVTVTINVLKKPQTLTWANPAPMKVGEKLGDRLNATSDAPGAKRNYTDAKNRPITADSTLPAGLGQMLKVTADETPTHMAVTTPVTVRIDVQAPAKKKTQK